MKVLAGTDIIEIDRIKDSIDNIGEAFIDRIYTNNEIEYCNSKNDAKYQHYAARFAAKEATFKAVSVLLNDKFDFSWKDSEVINDETGKPHINIFNEKLREQIESIDISISHCKNYATANVIIMCK